MADGANEEVSIYELRDVRRTFRVGNSQVKAIDGITLDIRAGESVAIEGPSGSGKTTLLQVLGALDQATGGSVKLAGRELTSVGDRELTDIRSRELGFVFQSFNLIPTLTAAENVEIAMVPASATKQERQARSAELLAAVGLSDRSEHLPSLMSGGEQQRVAIARALANNPRVILADEPTGNLDTVTSQELVTMLTKLAEDSGVTVIIVTHADEVASRVGRRIKMRDGRLVPDPGAAENPSTGEPTIQPGGTTSN
ncbi:MAG: ABC transporter ATP-binding protein [Actinomycetota bacterium]|nr:ABC transporter ATP-binding protein [Actinomycetota bacterium]